jgi:drug/metabolite transporter (DMT)-like permease
MKPSAAPTLHNRVLQAGEAWLVLCAVLQVCMGSLVVHLVSDRQADLPWMVAVRFLLGLGLMILPALAGHWSLRVHNRAAFVGRGVFGAAGMLVYFIVINKVGLGRGTVLANLAAVFATFAAIPLLKEWPRPAAWFAVVLATLGVLGCSTSGIPAGWEWLALLGALFGGLTFPFIRKLRQTDSNQISFLSQCVFGLVMVLPFLQLARCPVNVDIWGLMLGMIACDIASQFCLSHGFASVPVAKGTTILLLIPVLSLLAGVGLFGEHLSLRQWLSCVLVLAAAALAVIARAPISSGRNVAGASGSGNGMRNEPNPEQDAPATLNDQQGDIVL